MRLRSDKWKWLLRACLFLLVLLPIEAYGASPGQLRGVLRDQTGHPVANLALSLVKSGLKHSVKTDSQGQFFFRNLAAGEYLMQLDTTSFKAGGASKVRIRVGEAVFLTVVLDQLLGLDGADPAHESYEIRTILRGAADNRLIFRHDPGAPVDAAALSPMRNNSTVEVFAGGMSLSPGALSSATLTNFGRSEQLGEQSGYVLGVQMASGDDSLWKVRGLVHRAFSEGHLVEASLGYSRLRLGATQSMDWLDPAEIVPSMSQAIGSAETLALGLAHEWEPADVVSVRYGVEIDQVRTTTRKTYLNPVAEMIWQPWQQGELSARMTHRRASRYDSLELPDGESLDLADAIRATRIGSGLRMGVDRRYEISGAQQWSSYRAEIAFFRDEMGPGNAYRAYSGGAFRDLPVEGSVQGGIRAGLSREADAFGYSVDYILGTAPGLSDATEPFERLDRAIAPRRFHAVTGRLEGRIPRVNTVVTGVVRIAAGSRPVASIDPFNDSWDICNQSVNVFVRQVIPLPDSWGFAPRLEALLDLRNVLNQDAGAVQMSSGEWVLVRNPRAVRGGIALNF